MTESKLAKEKSFKKRLTGTVVSDKMDKTVVVAVSTLKEHQKYRKRYRSTTKYKAHDELNRCQVGDQVKIIECRPFSKDKKWRIIYDKNAATKEVEMGRSEE